MIFVKANQVLTINQKIALVLHPSYFGTCINSGKQLVGMKRGTLGYFFHFRYQLRASVGQNCGLWVNLNTPGGFSK
jgi:hypothetical protein